MDELRTLRLSTIGCFLIGAVGITVAAVSDSRAVLLDGAFNLVYAIAGLFTMRVARLVRAGDNKQFPLGYGFFEPFTNGAKGLLVLGLSLLALFDAISALVTGGRTIGAGMAIAYGVFATAACWGLAVFSARGARSSGSPLVAADAKNWRVNALISTAVLGGFLSILLLRGTSLEHWSPYVDPTLVLVVVLISLAVPVRMARDALMELLNRAPDVEIVEQVEAAVARVLESLPHEETFVRVIQPGRTRFVSVHVILAADHRLESLAAFDALRNRARDELDKIYPGTIVDLLFTADRKWGAPAGSKPAP